ncbi:MAG: AmmeMemoRadiSam system radical SAM enzyme, partial [Candidatus Omnitrophota bacterium]
CCLSCKYCQNWQISQANPEDASHYKLLPEAVIVSALRAKCKSIAYTYTEPTVFFEYMIDTARFARKSGLGNVYVTCGFINKKPLEELAEVLDSANVDLKGFNDDFYARITGGQLKPVLQCIKYLYKKGVIVEVTNLIVPTLNDNMVEIKEMCTWLMNEVSPDVPVHFSRFSPHYKLKHLQPTPISTLHEAWNVARSVGLHYVYIGNVSGRKGQDTVCPACSNVVVGRIGYSVVSFNIKDTQCQFCGNKIYGRWKL